MKAGYEIRMNDSHLEVIRHEAANIKQLQMVQRISAQLKGVTLRVKTIGRQRRNNQTQREL